MPSPVDIQAEVFASVPDALRRTGQVPEWAVINRHGAAVDCFLEGPAFDSAGNLFIVDIAWGRIIKIAPDGAMTVVAEYDGEPNGMKVMADGSLMVADYKHGLMRIDPATGAVQEHCTRYRLERFKGVNDLTVAADGAIWFTDQGQTGLQDPTGRIFRLDPKGDLSLVLDGIPSPNGLVLSPDERILYIGVTRGNAVWRMPIMPDGGPSKVGIFVQLSGGLGGPDGLALTDAGGVVVAHAGLGCVWIFSAIGKPLYRVQCPQGLMTTNIAFGGPDMRDLYITESATGQILKARLPVPGKVITYGH
jgi:gluconolactonase